MKCDILIRGGEVIDPSQNLRGVRDIAVAGGKIARIADSLTDVEPHHTVDARGLLVVPGLIDLHVHVYPHSSIGICSTPARPARTTSPPSAATSSTACRPRSSAW
jgi:predicted amidohydrolase